MSCMGLDITAHILHMYSALGLFQANVQYAELIMLISEIYMKSLKTLDEGDIYL